MITSSRTSQFRKFKKWVNSEVLPTIRKIDRYDMLESARKLAMKHICWISVGDVPGLVLQCARDRLGPPKNMASV